jgi:hypothetical protein
VQIIAAPWREDIALRVAFALERAGVATAPRPRARSAKVESGFASDRAPDIKEF